MKTYNIAGILIGLKHCFDPYLTDNLKQYAAPDETPKYRLRIDCADFIAKPLKTPTFTKGNRMIFENANETVLYAYDKNGDVCAKVRNTRDYTDFSITLRTAALDRLAEIEYIMGGIVFLDIALAEKRLAIHASAVAYRGRALLFSAPSQTGKSTLAAHWMARYGKDSRIINDDKPLLYQDGDGFYAAGSPFSGKDLLNENISVPLKAIVFIRQGKRFRLAKPNKETILKELMRNGARPRDEKLVGHFLEIIDALIGGVPFYVFHCTNAVDAARYLHDKLYSEGLT